MMGRGSTRDSPDAKVGRRDRLPGIWQFASENKGRVGCGLLLAFLGFLVLRGFVPSLAGSRLPPDLESAVAEAYARCQEDFPIWPGEVRMPTCDLVGARLVGKGRLPAKAGQAGIASAICYRVELERLYWGESGSQKHEMAWTIRTTSKVAVRQRGKWILYPDEEQQDAARWVEYACPGEYESSTRPVPRRA